MENKGENEKNGTECGAENQRGNAENMGENTKNVGNQDGDAGNQGGHLSIVVEITRNSNGNYKLKDC